MEGWQQWSPSFISPIFTDMYCKMGEVRLRSCRSYSKALGFSKDLLSFCEVRWATGEQLVGYGTTRAGDGWVHRMYELVLALAEGPQFTISSGEMSCRFRIILVLPCCTHNIVPSASLVVLTFGTDFMGSLGIPKTLLNSTVRWISLGRRTTPACGARQTPRALNLQWRSRMWTWLCLRLDLKRNYRQ